MSHYLIKKFEPERGAEIMKRGGNLEASSLVNKLLTGLNGLLASSKKSFALFQREVMK
jgi:hypothetical protein